MDVATMISEIDDYGFADTSSTRKTSKIQQAIWEIEGRNAWPFLQTPMFLNFDGTSDVPSNFPTNFRAALRLKDLITGRRIMPIRLDDFEDIVGMDYSLAGDPLYYYFEGNNLRVWPIPAASSNRIKFRYIKISTAITSTSPESAILIPPRYHEAIISGTLKRLFVMEDEPETASIHAQDYESLIQEMQNDLFMQQYDRPDMIHVVDPDDWDYESF